MQSIILKAARDHYLHHPLFDVKYDFEDLGTRCTISAKCFG